VETVSEIVAGFADVSRSARRDTEDCAAACDAREWCMCAIQTVSIQRFNIVGRVPGMQSHL